MWLLGSLPGKVLGCFLNSFILIVPWISTHNSHCSPLPYPRCPEMLLNAFHSPLQRPTFPPSFQSIGNVLSFVLTASIACKTTSSNNILCIGSLTPWHAHQFCASLLPGSAPGPVSPLISCPMLRYCWQVERAGTTGFLLSAWPSIQ